MKTLSERLKYAMEVLPPKKIKGVELARAVGVKPPSVSDWLTGKSKTMEGPNLIKAAKFLKVNSAWLGTGIGQPTDKDKESDSGFSNITFDKLELRKIPVLDFVQAGLWREVVYDGLNPMGWTYSDYQGRNPDEIFSVTIAGMSMSPRFMPNDKLVIDPNLAPQPGDFVVACNNDHEVTFKKYRVTGYDEEGREHFQLLPLNPDFAPLDSKINHIRIIGVVVSHIQNFR